MDLARSSRHERAAADVAAAMRARAADSADRVFLRFDDARWTFAETLPRGVPLRQPVPARAATRRGRSTSAC